MLPVSEARFRLLVESVKDYAIFMLDADGRVQTWNPGAQAAKGYQAREIIGQHISRFYTPEDLVTDRPRLLLERAIRDGRVEDEGWRVRKDGTRFWADVVITAVRDDTGQLIGFSKVTRDLTARRATEDALRQSEERLRFLIQSVKDYAIFMLDRQGHVVTWNSGAQNIKGYAPEEIIGQHFSLFYLPEDVASGKCEYELEHALAHGVFEEEGWRLRQGGERFWASVVLQPMRGVEGQLLGFAKVTRDLTERRAADEERLRLAQAQEAVRLRDEFLAIASHELKTPLTALQLQLEGLLRQGASMDPKAKRRAERAHYGAKRLSDLVETLLDVSRIASGKLPLVPVPFDLAQCARDVAGRFEEQAERDGCALVLRLDGPVNGLWDRLRVEQILTNLLANALKYAAGAPVEVAVSQTGTSAELSVTDQGPGIPESEHARIFGRFERAAPVQHYGGLGLGLYVAQQIAAAHRGSLHVEAVHPRGSRFILTLPCDPAAAPGA